MGIINVVHGIPALVMSCALGALDLRFSALLLAGVGARQGVGSGHADP